MKWLNWITRQPAPDTPVSFGAKMVWFAVRATDAGRVAAALGFQHAQAANWKTGVERAYAGDEVFITPPVDGWTLALGVPLSGDESDGDRGETLRNEGTASPDEPAAPNEDVVIRIAKVWSVDPTALADRVADPPALGLLARPAPA